MQGIEVVNWNEYYPEAIDWCLEKFNAGWKFGYAYAGKYLFKRTGITTQTNDFGFSKSTNPEDIKEALVQRKTASMVRKYFNWRTEIFKRNIPSFCPSKIDN